MQPGGDARHDPLHLVVAGVGPKAIFALEALVARLDGAGRIDVTAVDPSERWGCGSAYFPHQPEVLRLNVDAAILDAPAGGGAPSFVEWIQVHRPDLSGDAYPPRVVVGEYLALRWRWCSAQLAAQGALTMLRGEVVGVEHADGRWAVRVAPTGAENLVTLACDEVLIATGHARAHSGELESSWRSTESLIPGVFPVRTRLGVDQVRPGARVGVRGAALTFLDAALALTEGRGGRFASAEGGARMVHHRARDEPAVLLPTARHGLLLHPKPEPGAALPAPAVARLREGQRQLASLGHGTTAPVAQVLDAVVGTAADLLTVLTDRPSRPTRRAVEETLEWGHEPDLRPGPGVAEHALRRSIDDAVGRRTPGPAWALGRTWSALYREITTSLRGTACAEADWATFRRAAANLERFAFGPPLLTARKLLAMVESGAVDLSWLDAGTQVGPATVTGAPRGAAPVDVVIDAVLAPPGVEGVDDPLIRSLVVEGMVSCRPGRRGATVDPDGTPLDEDGRRVDGLALIGRLTEDHVIGHDTLNRHLHGEPEEWASRISGKVLTHARD